MKIKMVEVARRLGVSKAAVSLAVNGKPGVNEETRQKVLECIRQMEQEQEERTSWNASGLKNSESESNKNGQEEKTPAFSSETSKRMIKVVIMNHKKKVVCDPELDLWSEVLAAFDTEVRKMGYIYGFSYLNENEDEKKR